MSDDMIEQPEEGENVPGSEVAAALILYKEFVDLHWHVRQDAAGGYWLYFGARVQPDKHFRGIHLDFSETPVVQWDEQGIEVMADRLAAKVARDLHNYFKPRFAQAFEGIKVQREQDIEHEVEAFKIPDVLPDLLGGESEEA